MGFRNVGVLSNFDPYPQPGPNRFNKKIVATQNF